MAAVTGLASSVGIRAACDALKLPRSSYYRERRAAGSPSLVASRPLPARALRPERETVLAHLHEERFQDRSPAAVYATLLDEGRYHCSIRTMYRFLKQEGESRERRDQLAHPPYKKPELLATAPNQLWSWDITKLLGPAKWTYFYPLRDPGCLQPLRDRLDGRDAGKRRIREAADRGELREAKDPARPTHAACRSWHLDEFQASGLFTGGLGRQENPQPSARLG